MTRSRGRASRSGTRRPTAMLDAREGDGRFGPSQWVPNSAPRTLAAAAQPDAAQPILDPTPWVGGVKPFLIQSSSQFRSAPPPALDSAQWAAEFNEVKALGRADRLDPDRRADVHRQVVAERTRSELERSRPAAHRPERPRRRRQREAPRAAEPERARTRRSTAGTTSTTSTSGGRGTRSHERWRTATPRRIADPTWTALITAPYPEWVSGHNCLDAAHVAVLRMFFGDDARAGFQITSISRESRTAPRGAHVRHVLAAARRAHRGTHLGWPPLPQRGRGGPGARPERRQRTALANYFQPVGH